MQRRKMEEVVRFCFSHFFGLYSLDADYLQFLHVLPFLGVSLSLTHPFLVLYFLHIVHAVRDYGGGLMMMFFKHL